jgi:hypothetical protein
VRRVEMDWKELIGKLVTNDSGMTAYRVISYCESPTVELEDLETKDRVGFGIYGITAGEFVPLVPRK